MFKKVTSLMFLFILFFFTKWKVSAMVQELHHVQGPTPTHQYQIVPCKCPKTVHVYIQVAKPFSG